MTFRLLTAACVLAALAALSSCWTAEQPPYSEVIVVEGAPYDRGVAIGKRFESKIRSFYTSFLTNSILPYLNRERPTISGILKEYQNEEKYGNGQFSYQMFLQSGRSLARSMPQEYIDEMRGISDGSGVPYEQILVLNTFLDTMLSFRALTFFINQLQAPYIESVEFAGYEPKKTYDPAQYAAATEVPVDTRIRLVLRDKALLATPEGVKPEYIRIQYDKTQYVFGDAAITTNAIPDDKGGSLEVVFSPPGGFAPAMPHSLLIQAGDLSWVTDPPPAHARYMRDERITFTTAGAGLPFQDVANRGEKDGRTQPTPFAFVLRGGATKDGGPLAAQHYGLLDSNTSHKHTVLYVIKPQNGKPHMVLGWAGAIWGFSGMNTDGLVYIMNQSDTLDNPIVKELRDKFFDAKLLSSGLIGGLMGREVLSKYSTVAEAQEEIRKAKKSFGWNVMLADAAGAISVSETDCNIYERDDGGHFPYTPDTSDPANLDQWGRPFSSIGPDDLMMTTLFRKNVEDINDMILIYRALPQRYWTSFYFRALRTSARLRELITQDYGRMGPDEAQKILGNEDIVDTRDSMNAAVYLPRQLKMRYAMGQIPATSGPFVEFDLKAAVEKVVAK